MSLCRTRLRMFAVSANFNRYYTVDLHVRPAKIDSGPYDPIRCHRRFMIDVHFSAGIVPCVVCAKPRADLSHASLSSGDPGIRILGQLR